VGDLRRLSVAELQRYLGPRAAASLYQQIRGIASDRVGDQGPRKPLSEETTFGQDVSDTRVLNDTLRDLATKVAAAARREGIAGCAVVLEIPFAGFETDPRQRRLDHRPRTKDELNRLWYGRHNQTPVHYDSSRYHGVNLHNGWYRGTVEFRWFEATLHAGRIKAYVQFCLALAAKALNARSAASRKRDFNAQSAKYDFRVFLLGLGLIGEEFRTARQHLMANMPGDAAFKNGRPRTAPAANPSVTTEAGHVPGLAA